jgi:hypothetical protein
MASRVARIAAALAVTLPMTAGLLAVSAPSAGAAVTSPGNGTVFTSHASFVIRADYGRSSTENRLTLASPGGPGVTVATAPSGLGDGTLSYGFDTGCWTYPSSSCSGRRIAPNGTWTVTQTGGGSGTSTFVTRIRPHAPTSVAATALNSREIRLSWRVGDEPDLIRYTVHEGDAVVTEAARSSCESGTCSAVVGYATDGSGEHTYTVRAHRKVEPGSTVTLESAASAPVSVTLQAPPPPPSEPAADPSPQTGSGGDTGSGGQTSGGETSGGGQTGSESGTGSQTGSGGSAAPAPGSSTRPSAGEQPAPGSSGSGSSGTPAIGSGTAPSGASADQQAVAQREAFALTYSAFGPKLGIPKLPPLPAAQPPAIAPEIADGTYDTSLPGFDQDRVIREEVEVAQGPTDRVSNVVGSALDSERLLRSTAAAMILLLAGAHLRRWLGATHADH